MSTFRVWLSDGSAVLIEAENEEEAGNQVLGDSIIDDLEVSDIEKLS